MNESMSMASEAREDQELDIQIQEAENRRELLLKRQKLEELMRQNDLLLGKPASTDPANTSRSDDIKPERLPTYNAKSVREHTTFTQSAELAFRLKPGSFWQDARKITWCLQYLGNEPREAWFRHEKDLSASEKESLVWSDFSEFLLDLVESPINRQITIMQQYNDARQLPTQSTQAFAAYLANLESQLEAYSESQRARHLFAKIRPELRQLMSSYSEIPTTREGMVTLASRIETNNKENAKRSRHDSPNDFRSNKRPTVGARESSQGRPDEKATASNSFPRITCYNCNKLGHYSTDCSSPKRENPNKMPIQSNEIKAEKGRGPTQARRRIPGQ